MVPAKICLSVCVCHTAMKSKTVYCNYYTDSLIWLHKYCDDAPMMYTNLNF